MLYRLQRNNTVSMQDINLERIVNLKLIYQEEEKQAFMKNTNSAYSF